MKIDKSELSETDLENLITGMTLKEARALGDSTRYQIFRFINDAHRPVYINELTDLLQVNHNAVRQHLAVLKDAQLVTDQLENRSKPGRPRLQYTLNSQVLGTRGTEGPYQTVAVLLAEVIKSNRSPREIGRDAGKRRIQRVKGPKQNIIGILNDSLLTDGFKPRTTQSDNGWDFVLENCPYVEVALVDPDTVCQIHLGFLEGLMEELDRKVDLSLTVRDPRRAGCCVRVCDTKDTLAGHNNYLA